MNVRRAGIVAACLAIVASRDALATHNHPETAASYVVWFVPAYAQCVSPTPGLVHPAGFGLPAGGACAPTTGSTVGFGPQGQGWAEASVIRDTNHQATDVSFEAKLADVQEGGLPFDGTLTVAGIIRMTDHYCVPPAPDCTLIDVPFPIQLPCGTAISPHFRHGSCHIKTTFNASLNGTVVPGKEMNVGIAQLQIFRGVELVFEGGLSIP